MVGRLKRHILRETERRLRTYGWRKGRWGNRRVGYCLVGAVRASSRRPHLLLLRHFVYRDLARCTIQRYDGFTFIVPELISWNDTFGREIDEVEDALRCARGEEATVR